MIELAIGQPYPFSIHSEGAISEFLRPSNTLIVAISSLEKSEVKALKRGDIKVGLLYESSAILLIWQFFDEKGRKVFTLDSPFNANAIKDLNLPDITKSSQRLAIDVHVVDLSTNLTKVLRSITMSNEFTLEFLTAVQKQVSSVGNFEQQVMKWFAESPDFLAQKIKMHKMGI